MSDITEMAERQTALVIKRSAQDKFKYNLLTDEQIHIDQFSLNKIVINGEEQLLVTFTTTEFANKALQFGFASDMSLLKQSADNNIVSVQVSQDSEIIPQNAVKNDELGQMRQSELVVIYQPIKFGMTDSPTHTVTGNKVTIRDNKFNDISTKSHIVDFRQPFIIPIRVFIDFLAQYYILLAKITEDPQKDQQVLVKMTKRPQDDQIRINILILQRGVCEYLFIKDLLGINTTGVKLVATLKTALAKVNLPNPLQYLSTPIESPQNVFTYFVCVPLFLFEAITGDRCDAIVLNIAEFFKKNLSSDEAVEQIVGKQHKFVCPTVQTKSPIVDQTPIARPKSNKQPLQIVIPTNFTVGNQIPENTYPSLQTQRGLALPLDVLNRVNLASYNIIKTDFIKAQKQIFLFVVFKEKSDYEFVWKQFGAEKELGNSHVLRANEFFSKEQKGGIFYMMTDEKKAKPDVQVEPFKEELENISMQNADALLLHTEESLRKIIQQIKADIPHVNIPQPNFKVQNVKILQEKLDMCSKKIDNTLATVLTEITRNVQLICAQRQPTNDILRTSHLNANMTEKDDFVMATIRRFKLIK